MKDKMKEGLKPVDKILRDLAHDLRRCKIVRDALRGFLSLESEESAKSAAVALRELNSACDQFSCHLSILRGLVHDALVLLVEPGNGELPPDRQPPPTLTTEAAEN
jgi:hypothetical protein